ncbi:MAG: adenosine deaminase [Bryobacteraceae bacterium]|nr:adenosine deaminase [Bryobacteraceae bacterium]
MSGFIHQLKKTELHVHLEGSVEPETLRELDPSLDDEELRRIYDYSDFLGFLRSYKWINLRLTRPEHFALIARRLLERLERQNVLYAEVNLSVGVWLWRELEFEPYFAAVAAEAERSPVRVRFIFDAVRQFGVDAGWAVARLAAAHQARGVLGFGIGGDEAKAPAKQFHAVFSWVKCQGLHVAPHAGEVMGAASVWDALECGAERIGHGIRSIEDPALVEHLASHRIPLEVCISSNVRTGAVASLREHPVRRLFDAGVPITLNTDDPPMFGTTLEREYQLAADEFGFSEAEMQGVARNGFEFAFDESAREMG